MKRTILIISSLLLCLNCISNNINNKSTMVKLSTTYGDIKIKLYDETPQHRDNFIKLVKQGFYNDLLFHRIIKDFMIQGGDPDSKNAQKGKMLGTGDVGYTIPAEFNENFYHKKGALCAARQGDQVNPLKASSGCQFYIVKGKPYNDNQLNQLEASLTNKAKQDRFNQLVAERKDEIKQLRINRDTVGLTNVQNELSSIINAEFLGKGYKMSEQKRNDYKTIGGTPFLDNDYTVFGEVVEGLDIIDTIAEVKTNNADRPDVDIKFTITILD